jgi:hypothetical protein
MELSLGMDVSRPTKAGSTPTQFHSPDYGGALSSNSRYCRKVSRPRKSRHVGSTHDKDYEISFLIK